MKIVISDVNLVRKKFDGSPLIRFTYTWMIDTEVGKLGDTTEGCLLLSETKGVRWTPPLARVGFNQSIQPRTLFPDSYELVLSLLNKAGYVDRLREAQEGVLTDKKKTFEDVEWQG